jgi:hypothetical protein
VPALDEPSVSDSPLRRLARAVARAPGLPRDMTRLAHLSLAGYEAVEHVFGVVTPVLGALTVLDFFQQLAWAWLLFFWMSCGHWALYWQGTYPRLTQRPFVRGLFAFGVGLLWPVWLARRASGRLRS